MTTNNPIATQTPTIWEPLHDAFSTLLDQVNREQRESFSVAFEIESFSPYPYIQVWLNDEKDYVVEFTSNVYLEPDLNKEQKAILDSIGWRKPNGRNPNYTKTVERGHAVASLARYITTTLRMVYQLDESVWIIFDTQPLDALIYKRDSFWHRLDAEGVVCFIGKNAEHTIEGIS